MLVTQVERLKSEPFWLVMSERAALHVFITPILQLKKMRRIKIRSRKLEFRATKFIAIAPNITQIPFKVSASSSIRFTIRKTRQL